MKHLIQAGDVVTGSLFEKPKGMMSAGGSSKIEQADWPKVWDEIMATPIQENTLAYIHIPFCINHCVFCGFYRNKWKENLGTPYVDRLIAELEYEASRRATGGSINAVYLGGGTPTVLSAPDLSRLIRTIRETLPLTEDCEITVEGRISHFTQDKVDACVEAGANRFSIGVQTFDGDIRRKLGRKHSGEDAAKYMKNLASTEGAVVVLDLIYGLPGQSDEIWKNDIETALNLGLDGLDVYSFKCFPSLPINRMIEKGALPILPDTNSQAAQYAYAVRRLQAANWSQISNSHFASTTKKERNIYNSQIKFGTPFLAFGSGAGGNHAGYSYSGHGDLEQYLKTPLDQKPLGSLSKSGNNQQRFGHLQGSLEQGSIEYEFLPKNEQVNLLLNQWQDKGLLEVNEDKINLTIPGRYWATSIIRSLNSEI